MNLGGELLACVGGPHDRQWFTAEDWGKLLLATGRTYEKTGVAHSALGYSATARTIPHPEYENVYGLVLEWKGMPPNDPSRLLPDC